MVLFTNYQFTFLSNDFASIISGDDIDFDVRIVKIEFKREII